MIYCKIWKRGVCQR